MEARTEQVNESTKLIAKSIELLNQGTSTYDKFVDNVELASGMLQDALDKLTRCST